MLLKNAIDAVKDNGKINIGIFCPKKFITIAIKDNGTGIKNEDLLRVTEPFFSTKKG